MPCQLPVSQLIDVLCATPLDLSDEVAAAVFSGVTTDTRNIKPGQIFLALRGETFDGHDYGRVAIEKGALAVVAEPCQGNKLEGVPQLQVNDTLQAYQQLARWWRNQFDIPVIAVTGSAGKTTTKELIAAVLSTQGNVLKTHANYNNEIGVPKTLLELSPEHDFAVIEMAMRGSGQIALLTQIARPTIGVITNVGTAHIGLLGSKEAIAKAKCELLAEMPATSVAVLNHDNSLLIETAATVWQGETLTVGLESGDLQGQLVNLQTLVVEGISLPVPLIGSHNAQNYLAALAVAKVLGIDWTPLTEGLSVQMPAGRSQRYELSNDIIILDETYNAGLESTIAALHLLVETPGKRHIAVLGAMKELGERSPELHQQVGHTAEQLNLDALLITVDDSEANAIATGVRSVPTECFTSHEALIKRLLEFVQPGDRILFKASRSIGLDRVVHQFRESMSG
ncbi:MULTISPECIES: UDP-N-acetylmuramoyl-tripeptide--D-alanyl-D-alanine ligase [unclassified Coleofasciculus]|uniref:UDP-N-acetylmuramoyl-tripeptide--D-alanyl-D- alanine ligase n=1 Tax=unclassified Coleofasciculus TaxID=2692782 RepID=UPI00187EDF91|nr:MULTISPECIES: UDP-N-acetylmuramoyl-tripeptide--D-alanyl-D-alanine ligase [unclassified Coleofasciculus]MBE9125988.1 UDP-N-acetylmuramoyl-tripeptide--D-alanyl-D-alanine ligase [Coleofasciculus sp. LEGE 07081]MBE9151182.1 UDP-N-acetylmuramoyl-tripeptide--D-alanyl-D-alanine ligase [Coleofasciculus sp. LEGE 07092]